MNRFICYGLLLFSFPVLADHGYQNHENYFDNYPSNDTTISNAAYDADTGIWDFSHASGSETWNIIWSPYNSTGDSYNYSFEMRTYEDTGSFVSGQRLIRMDAGKRMGGTCAYDAPYNCSWSSGSAYRFWNDGVVDVSDTLDYSGTGYSDWTLYSGSHDISGWNDSGLAFAYWHVSGLTGDGTNGPQIRNFYGCVDCTLPGLIDDGTAELFTYVNDGVCDYTAIEDPDCTNEVYVDETYETASSDGQDDGSSSNDGQDDGSSGYEEETYYEPEPETYTDTGGQEESYQDDGSTGDTGQEETYQEEPQEEYSNDQVAQTEPGPPNINPDAPLANDMDVVNNSIAGSFRRTVNSRSITFLQSVGGINNMSGGPSGYNSQGSGGAEGGTGGSGSPGNMMVAQNDPIGWNINQIMMNQGIMGNTQEEEAVGDNPLGSDELEEELSIKDLGGLGINSIKQPNLLDNKNWYSDRNILEQSGIYDDQEFYKQKEMYNEVEWYGT